MSGTAFRSVDRAGKRTLHDDPVAAALRQEVAHAARLRRRDLVLAAGTPLALLILWEISSFAGWIDVRLFSSPRRIAEASVSMIANGELVRHLVPTVLRLSVGYLCGAALGVLVGMLMGIWRPLRASMEPTFTALYSLPKIAILPLLLLIFGLNETPRVLSVVISVFFVMQINTLAGILHIDHGILETGRAYNATGWKRFRFVILPAATPQIFTGLRVAAGMAVVVVTAVEFVNSKSGLGYLIWNSWQLFQPVKMYVGLISVSIVGASLTFIVIQIEKRLLPWREADVPTKQKEE